MTTKTDRSADSGRQWNDLAAGLERVAGRRIEAGHLCMVVSPPGAGKTTFLTRLGLGEAIGGGNVVHITLDRPIEQVQARYDALYGASSAHLDQRAREALREEWIRRRTVQSFSDGRLHPGRLMEILDIFSAHLKISPRLILVDGNDWPALGPEHLGHYKQIAFSAGAALWLAAQVRQPSAGLPAPLLAAAEQIDLAVLLEAGASSVGVRLLQSFGRTITEPAQLLLDAATLRPLQTRAIRLDPCACTLLSGAAPGAEAAFGACAERWGVAERNFTFLGRSVARMRGIIVLGDEELLQGDISWAYLKSRLGRQFDRTDTFRKIFQSIWHQVNPAGEVFAVGRLQQDQTVRGGTGWAVELAKQMHKPVRVFDQDQERWFRWEVGAWQPEPPPRIRQALFAGGGTRSLTPAGSAAIHDLFERTFCLAPPSRNE